MRRQYHYMDNSSGVGVIDKAAHVLDALEAGPTTLAQLVAATGLARPTVHRLALALVHHRLVSRDIQGRFVLGSRLVELASAAGEDRLIASAGPVLMQLRDATGESAQIFRRQGDWRVCVASAERPIGLRDTIPVGTQLSMKAGSAAQVLLAWEDHDRLLEGLQAARFTPTVLAGVRRRGWGQSLGEREPGVASVSAPVRGPSGRVIAAVSISGPIERLTRQPGRLHAEVVCNAARLLPMPCARAPTERMNRLRSFPARHQCRRHQHQDGRSQGCPGGPRPFTGVKTLLASGNVVLHSDLGRHRTSRRVRVLPPGILRLRRLGRGHDRRPRRRTGGACPYPADDNSTHSYITLASIPRWLDPTLRRQAAGAGGGTEQTRLGPEALAWLAPAGGTLDSPVSKICVQGPATKRAPPPGTCGP